MKTGILSAYKTVLNGAPAVRLVVAGNVEADGREILNKLGLRPCVDMANRREIICATPADLDAIRTALLASGVVSRDQV